MHHDFTVPDLSCGHCVRAVTEAVKRADAAATISADPASKRVAVDSALPREQLAAVLEAAGYRPAQAPAA